MANLQQKSRWTLLYRTRGGKVPRGVFKCECGTVKEINLYMVSTGQSMSCGCYARELKRTHGLTKHPLYKLWGHMKERCYKEVHPCYSGYGGRGVRVCDEWRNDFKAFYDWCMANGWQRGLQIDKDKKGDGLLYSPETCSILTVRENNYYRRNNRILEYKGERMPMRYWADKFGINDCTLRDRLRLGMSVEESLEKPVMFKRKRNGSRKPKDISQG